MGIQINYLSIDFTIGGHQLFLETTKIPSRADAAAAPAKIADSIKGLIMNQTYKMADGKVITVSLTEFFATIADKIPDGLSSLQDFFTEVAGATTGIYIDLWDIYLITATVEEGTTKKGSFSFGFKVRVNLTTAFYANLNVPTDVTKLISLNSLGLGVAYDKEFTMT